MLIQNTKSPVTHQIHRKQLNNKIQLSQKKVRETIKSTGSKIEHHTQARNCKLPNTVDEQQQAHEDVMAGYASYTNQKIFSH
jgi:hypothetical protein